MPTKTSLRLSMLAQVLLWWTQQDCLPSAICSMAGA